MDKLFLVYLTLERFGNPQQFTCTEGQVENFKTVMHRNFPGAKVFLNHNGGTDMFRVEDIISMRISEVDADCHNHGILMKEIHKAPLKVLHLALEKLVGGILATASSEHKAHLEKYAEGLKYDLVPRPGNAEKDDTKIPTVDEMRALNAEESRKKCSIEKYEGLSDSCKKMIEEPAKHGRPTDDRILTKPHCCVHEHGLMREATPEERLAAIKKAS